MSLRGYIDGVIGDELVGWALDDDELGSRLRVRGELDGVVLGTVEASEPRRDLVKSGFGDANHGFRIALDPGLLTPGVHSVAALVGQQALPLAPDWIVHDLQDRPRESVRLAAATHSAEAAEPVAAPAPAPLPVREPAAARTSTTPTPLGRPEQTTVVTGAAGWMFVVPAGGGAPSHAQLDADAAAIEQLHALARSLGIAAQAVALPAKYLLYAEHLPAEHRADPKHRSAREVAARLRDSDEATLLDLYDAMQDARAHGRLYPRTGRTLTWTGAIHAYRAIVKAQAGSYSRFRPHPVDAFGFGRLGPVEDALQSGDTEPILTVRPSAAPAGAPTGLVIHDGTAGRVAELLRMQFWRCEVVVAAEVDAQLVRSAGADVVIWMREDR